jgi:DNA-binding response OmpR family regulator
MGMRISQRDTTVLVLSNDVGLIRLAQLILAPTCTVIGRAPLSANVNLSLGQTDVVIIDEESIDHDMISAAKRACPDARVIALAPELGEADRVVVLDADADYLPRPFKAHELVARVQVAALKRFSASGRPRTYRDGSLVFDLFHHKLVIEGRPIPLDASELAVLLLLTSRPGAVVEHNRLLTEIGVDVTGSSLVALRSCVSRLRRKIERDPLHPVVLLTVGGVGYRHIASTKQPSRSA